jgi:hypothetical protein
VELPIPEVSNSLCPSSTPRSIAQGVYSQKRKPSGIGNSTSEASSAVVCIGVLEDIVVNISRLRSVWSGFVGGPGVSTMYFLDTDTAVESVHAFWTELIAQIPDVVSIQVESTGDVIDDETGELQGAWVAEPVAAINCSGSGNYAAPVGAVINWLTGDIAHGHRLRGKTFVVPCVSADMDSDGSLGVVAQSVFKGAGDGLISTQAASFVIWHRGTGSDGSTGLVTSCQVPDIAAVLRSRRD